MRSLRTYCALALMAAGRVCGQTLELEGYMVSADGARFVVSERDSKRHSGWMTVGDRFAGYTLDRFDAEKEVVVLRNGEETLLLPLKASSVRPGLGLSIPTGPLDAKGRYAQAMEWLNGATDDKARFHHLGRAAKESFNIGKFADAEKLAREMLELLPKYPQDFAYGANRHDANMVLGRLALHEGETEKAIDFLIAAAKDNPGGPGPGSFGPNVSLAKDLLERGERDAVLQYLEQCRTFWKNGGKYINEWTQAIKSGGMPQFGSNLLY